MEKQFALDCLSVSVFDTREELGRAGAARAAQAIRSVIAERGRANLIFASSPSQMDVLDALRGEEGIDWKKVNAFHMDEYVGIAPDAPQSFGNYLRTRFFCKLPIGNVFYFDGLAADAQAECARYAALLQAYPPDITFAGIGENGHLAFNDPGIAQFDDPQDVKLNLGLDDICIQQQVKDGWFASYEDVPKMAFTLTIPALLRAQTVFVAVPSKTKAEIVRRFVRSEISEDCPSTILRRHPHAFLWLDADAASLL